MSYRRLLIQQATRNGSTYTAVGNMVDTNATYHVACQEFPFMRLPEIKDLATREWFDEHGDDVYVSPDGLFFKSYEVEATFIYVGTTATMQSNISDFINFLYGRNGGSPILCVYDEYTKQGRGDVIVTKVSNELYWDSDGDDDKIATFKVTFKVNDPVTDVSLPLNSSSSSSS